MNSYLLLDSGADRKLEQFGPYVLSRPCGQAVWQKTLPEVRWASADAVFSRNERWHKGASMPHEWSVSVEGISFILRLTEFGHLGIFAEQIPLWRTIASICSGRRLSVLNLFAYSGGSTMAAALHQASVCHVDASNGMVEWARKNAALNGLDRAPIRWIVEDVSKFLMREIRRGNRYDAIILDPPSFGRGSKGEVFKIEDSIIPLLSKCRECLSNDPEFILLSSHTPGFTPIALSNLLTQTMGSFQGSVEAHEMTLSSPGALMVPSGSFAMWRCRP